MVSTVVGRFRASPGFVFHCSRKTAAMVLSEALVQPARRNRRAGVKKLKGGEHKPWPPQDLATFRTEAAPHLVLAMELALWTGQRQGDIIRLRWDDLVDGHVHLVQEMTGKELWIPITRPLATVLAGAPRTVNVLAQAFADELKRVALDGRVFHGLRKTTAVMLAEHDCTTKQIAAITGQSDQMVEHYTKGADQRRLAKAAVVKLERPKND